MRGKAIIAVGFWLSLGLLSVPQAAHASDIKPTLEEARAAFVEGRQLMGQKSWADAEAQFSFAVRARNTPGLRYHVGYCQEKGGRRVEALSSYSAAQELLEQAPAPDVEELIPEAISRVAQELPEVDLKGVPSGAQLRVDGKPRPLSLQFPLNPGQHTLRISKEGYSEFAVEIELEARERVSVDVEMHSTRPEPASGIAIDEVDSDEVDSDEAPEPQAGSSAAQRAVFWSSVSLGAVGLGVGVVGTVLFSQAGRHVESLSTEVGKLGGVGDSSCADPEQSLSLVCEDLGRAGQRRDTMGALMIGGYTTMGVGALGAVAAHFLWPEGPVAIDVGRGSSPWFISARGSF
jgi:hypothetical protein